MKDETISHASYGVVSFSRISSSGKRRLFGSTLDTHYHSIRLKISRADLLIDHDLHMERPHARETIVEVELSAAQFAELLTTMNVGDGTPCTIQRFGGKQIEEPPAINTESTNVREDFAAKMRSAGPEMKRRAAEVMTLLPASLNKGTRRKIEIGLGNIVEAVAGNATFALDQFQEAASRVTASAKAEIDAVLTHAVHLTGIKALRAAVEEGKPLALPEHAASETSDGTLEG